MNWLDIVIGLLLVYAVWEGWKQGAVRQILGLVAVLAGVLLAWRYGREIGEWMGAEGSGAVIAGFIVVLIVVVIAVVVLGRLTQGLFRVAGFGVFDNILGVVFSVIKMCLFIGLLMIVADVLSTDGSLVPQEVRDGSAVYGFVEKINGVVFPFIEGLFK